MGSYEKDDSLSEANWTPISLPTVAEVLEASKKTQEFVNLGTQLWGDSPLQELDLRCKCNDCYLNRYNNK